MAENIGSFIFILPELIGMRSEVFINDGAETSITSCTLHPPSTDNTLVLLADHQLSQTGSAKPMVAWLDTDRKNHYFEAVATRYLLLKGLQEVRLGLLGLL